MALTPEHVKKIATLARLRFSPDEEAKLTGQLGGIVDYIDQLQRYDLPEVGEPAGGGPAAPEADDSARPCLPREQLLANAPAAMDGFLLVPEVKGGGEDA
ncbi:MAG TPA: Asp-tRNA(Asn)/Glu-tRNA(Gln) amidotransferase subunit GatC [Thermoanaerobaculia bacterium]|nr:Asp-tRNA(Asn)/Glu-tRNA(Gln) amidotransferase subunit GatC [Thermoanaerobaculia bacterium]